MVRKQNTSNGTLKCTTRGAGLLFAVTTVGLLSAAWGQIQVNFGEIENFGPAYNTGANEGVPKERADGLERFMGSDRAGTYGDYDMWVSSRETTADEWSEWVNLGPSINTSVADSNPSISADGLALYFSSTRSGGYGDCDIWVTRRSEPNRPWEPPVNLGWVVNSPTWDAVPCISADGLALYFESERPGGYGSVDLWVSRRATPLAAWQAPVNLGANINSTASDGAPWLFADGRGLLFTSSRGSGQGGYDVWMCVRDDSGSVWGAPANLDVNSGDHDGWPSVAADGSMLYLASARSGGYGSWDAWRAPIIYGPVCGDQEHPHPLGDLNRDCVVNMLDLAILCEHWLADTRPMDPQ